MGLKSNRFASLLFLSVSFSALIHAAPTLRLASSTVGPVSIATGANGSAQIVEAYNAGTGTLNLSALSGVSWLATTIGASRACTTTTAAQSCIPISILLNTASLTAGTYTGIITVSDPNAADAPQTITVTVNIGGSVPSNLTVYVAPGGTVDTPIPTNSGLGARPTTTDGNPWLSLTVTGAGSFKFNFPYLIRVQPQAANGPGTYTGSLALSGSSFAPDNKTVAVTMNVTTGAIAQQPAPITFTMAEGVSSNTSFGSSVTILNTGQSGLTVGAPTVTTTGGNWLTATGISNGAVLSFDASSLTAGTYTGTVKFTTNAVAVCNVGCTAGGTVTVPVTLTVLAKGAPVISFQGVQDNATFVPGDTVSQGDVMVVKGSQLSLAAIAQSGAPPLPTTLADTTVLVNGVAAPLYYTSFSQIAFQMPVNTPTGVATVQVKRTDGSISNSVTVNVAAGAPKLLQLFGGPYAAAINAKDVSLPMPTSFSSSAFPAHPATAGDTLEFFAIGLGPTNPSVATGQPAPSGTLANLIGGATVSFGGGLFSPNVTPDFVGLAPGFAGLYQINVRVPSGLRTGTTYVTVETANGVSNAVAIEIQ